MSERHDLGHTRVFRLDIYTIEVSSTIMICAQPKGVPLGLQALPAEYEVYSIRYLINNRVVEGPTLDQAQLIKLFHMSTDEAIPAIVALVAILLEEPHES